MDKEITVLTAGEKHSRAGFVQQLRQTYGQPYSPDELEQYRRTILSVLVSAFIALLDYVDDFGGGLVSPASKEDAATIRSFAAGSAPNWLIEDHVATAFTALWRKWPVKQAFATMQQHGQAAYYLRACERICQPSYIPTHADVKLAPEDDEVMKETILMMNKTSLRVVELPEPHTPKIISQFAGVQFCLFVADLASYDRFMPEKRMNELQARLAYFKMLCCSAYLSKSILMLVFTGMTAFKHRLSISPLKTHFADYYGGNDPIAASKYIMRWFSQMNKNKLPLFWHVYDEDAGKKGVEMMTQFFEQSVASINAAFWLREIGAC
jgi:hypothetical protein